MSSSMSLPGTCQVPRSRQISEEVKFQRQRIQPSEEQPKLAHRGKFNTLTTISSPSTKPVQRSIRLYFYRRGIKAGFHGSPILVEFIHTEQVPNWQQYLKNIVLQHPAWLAYPNIKSFELHLRLPICVGFWDGTTTGVAPNANPLQNNGLISDLLRLTDNPKRINFTQTQLSTTKSSKITSPILRMAITIHIRSIGEDSEEEDNNIQLRIKQEDTSNPPDSLPSTNKQQPSLLSYKLEPSNLSSESIIDTSTSNIEAQAQSLAYKSASPTGSTTQEDTPPPSYIPADHQPSSSHLNLSSSTHIPSSERPSTPTAHLRTQSVSARKQGLTLLSPQQISIQSTRELKRKSNNSKASSSSISAINTSSISDITTDKLIDLDKVED